MKLGKFQKMEIRLLCIGTAMQILLFASVLNIGVIQVQSEKILVLVPMGSKSHKNIFEPLVEALSERGHSLTVVSSYPPSPSKSKKNVREIIPSNFSAVVADRFGDPFKQRSEGGFRMLASGIGFVIDGCRDILQNEEFSNLSREKFDLILLDAFMNDCMAGFIHKSGAPFILVSPTAAPSYITAHAGNRLPPSFVPFVMSPYTDDMTFLQRASNLLLTLLVEIFTRLLMERELENVYREVYGEPDLPSIPEIYADTNLILMNSHFTFNFPRPTLPDVVEVGGMQCGPGKPLPKDLEEFISGGQDGVIFFSLGSIIQGNQMPENVRQIFVNVFSRLKERVLWKWETEKMEGLPPNVKLGKWLPQQDILSHKNVKLFITHGGLLSTQEATYHGVPLLGIPIMGDQDLNANQAERAGYALKIEILTMTEEILETAIKEMLSNNKYADRAKELSQLFRDQTETPLERAVFWSEYVMRHDGAKHLRSAARKLNFFQYHSLDVVAALAAILIIILWIVKIAVVKIIRAVLSTFGFGKGGQTKTNTSLRPNGGTGDGKKKQ